MVYVVLELNGYKQLQRLEPDLVRELEKALAAIAEFRGGAARRPDNGTLLYRFDDAGEAAGILAAAFAIRDHLLAREELRGFILFAESFPDGEREDSALRDLRGWIFNRETGDDLLVGPRAADLFGPYCDLEAGGGLFRAREKTGSRRPELGKLGDFCSRPLVLEKLGEELSRRLDRSLPAAALLVCAPPLSGAAFPLEAALDNISGGAGVFTLRPSFRDPRFPAADLPGADDPAGFPSAADKRLWESHAAFLAYLRNEESGLFPDFPEAEAREALSAALSAHIRRCGEKRVPAVILCGDLERFSESAGRLAADLVLGHLESRRILAVLTSTHSAPSGAFRAVPCETFRVPPVGAEEFKALLRRLPSGSFPVEGLTGFFRRSRGRAAALYYELAAGAEADGGGPEEAALPEDVPDREDLRPLVRFLLKQERTLREVLYTLEETAGILSPARTEELLERIGVNRAQSREIVRRLREWGLPGQAGALPFLRKDPSIRHGLIDEETAAFLFDLRSAGAAGADDLLLRYFAEKGFFRQALDTFRLLLAGALDAGNLEKAAAALETGARLIPDGDEDIRDGKKAVALTAKLRLALAADDPDGMVETFSRMDDLPPPRPRDPYHGDTLIQKALYSLRLRDVPGGLAFGKGAAMIFQDTSDPEGAARANGVIGLAMLAAGDPDEATDYFRIGREAAGEKYPLENLRNALLEGIAWFIRGNFSRVLEICPAAARAADAVRMRRWSLAARFILARTHFELGDYAEARKILEFLAGETRRLGLEAAGRVVSCWLARSLAYGGDPGAGLALLDGIPFHPEALFFAAEAEFFRGNGGKARENIENFLRIPYEGDCFLGDAFLWKDGFYFLENLSVGRTRGSEVLPHLAKTFLAFISGLSRENPAAIEEMSRLIREEKNPKNDPFDMLYYYWYSRILPESRDSAFEDKTTVLGRAVRHLQSRASRIDETAHAYAFQRRNSWNRQLLEDARRRNLI